MISSANFPAHAVAPKIRDYLSYSAMNLYRSCPLRYKFRYQDGLPEEAVSANLVFGSAVHRAAELHFNRLLAGEPLPSTDEMLEAYHHTWRNQLQVAQVQFGKDDDVSSLSKLAGRMLEAFRCSPAAQPAGHVIGVEEELRGAIISGVPDLLGRVDLLIETDDAVVIADLKTSRSRWSRDQAEDSAEQLLLYSELVKHLVPGKPLRLQYVVLTKTKEPVVDVHELPVEPPRVVRTKKIVEQVWRGIAAELFYPVPSPLNCNGCPFHKPCRNWSG